MRRLLPLAPFLLLACCEAVPPPAPLPPAPAPVPAPAPAPAPPPAFGGDWRDWRVTPGSWVYRQDARGSIALFGVREDDALLTLRCDRLAGQLFLSRRGATPGAMTIRTSSTARTLTARPTGGALAYMAVALPTNDVLVDAMGFSRGRFIVETPPMPPLVIPAWPEVLRVAEDCRR